MTGFIYLMAPYSHVSEAIRTARVESTAWAAAVLTKRGFHIFAPTVHGHALARAAGLPLNIEFWMNVNIPFMKACEMGLVLTLDGWESSKGIQREVTWFNANGKRIEYVNMLGLQNLVL